MSNLLIFVQSFVPSWGSFCSWAGCFSSSC